MCWPRTASTRWSSSSATRTAASSRPAIPISSTWRDFRDVRMVGITREQQQRNLAALNRLIQMAHDRGLKFTVGHLGPHLPRRRAGRRHSGRGRSPAEADARPGVGRDGRESRPLHQGGPGQVRAAGAGGGRHPVPHARRIRPEEQRAGGVLARRVPDDEERRAPNLRLDLRAKGLPDSVIQSALDAGVPFRITTKYWMEQMGLPFHPTHINQQNQFDRRHSYADLLRYPQRYKMHWRLWNGGTARVLLVGRSGLRAALRRKHPPLRRRRLRGERAALHEDGGPAARREAVRPAEAGLPLLRLRVRALLAFLPGVRPPGLQPQHARRKSGSGSSRGASARTPRPSSRRGCTGRAGSCRASSPPAIPTATSP